MGMQYVMNESLQGKSLEELIVYVRENRLIPELKVCAGRLEIVHHGKSVVLDEDRSRQFLEAVASEVVETWVRRDQ